MCRFSLVALVLLISLLPALSGTSAAAPNLEVAARSGTGNLLGDLLSQLWNMLGSLWTNKEGCTIDPLGSCSADPPRITKAGCRVDPLGSCSTNPAPATKAGCSIDPLGGCASGSGK